MNFKTVLANNLIISEIVTDFKLFFNLNVKVLTVVGVITIPLPTGKKSPLEICEFWLSLEKSEWFDMLSLNSDFILFLSTYNLM